jgi:hypothetical protein
MTSRKMLPVFFIVFIVAACAFTPQLTKEQIDAGPMPDCEAVIKAYLREALFDPDSLKDFSIDAPCKEIILSSGFPGFNLYRGQKVYECRYVWYNAKNRYGGYTGKNPHIYFIRYNKVVGSF